MKQAGKISWRYKHGIFVQGYTTQVEDKANYCAALHKYKETTEDTMQMDLEALEMRIMDICFAHMMDKKNTMPRTGDNMMKCMIDGANILKNVSIILEEKARCTDLKDYKHSMVCAARTVSKAAIKADDLVNRWAQEYKESDKNEKADWT